MPNRIFQYIEVDSYTELQSFEDSKFRRQPILALPMSPTFEKASGILIALLILLSSASANSQDLDEFMKELILNDLSDATVSSAETTYQRLVHSKGEAVDCAEWHRCTSTILMAGLTGQRDLYANSVLFDIESSNCPEPEGPWWPYLVGNAYFMTNNHEKAAAFYSKIDWNPESDVSNFSLFVNARLNLSSALNGMGDVHRAVETIDELVQTCKSYEEETQTELDLSFYDNLSINLAGLLISNRDFERAESTLQTLDAARLDERWQQVVTLNRLIIFQETGRFEQSDSIWMKALRMTEFAGVPEATYNILIRQSLLSDDPLGFLDISEVILTNLPHVLQDSAFYYANLIESVANDGIFEERWKVYSGIERDRSATLALQVKAITQKSSDRISELTSELENKRATTAQWQMIALFIGLILLSIIGGYAILQRRKGMVNQRKLDAMLSSKHDDSRVDELELKLDDIRTLGDAIAHGKKTSDAMLILKKISMKHMPENLPKKLDLNVLENYSALTTSEQKILKDMIAGLDAKEIARILNLSPSHIYNSRSNIRRKLEIPKEQSIEDWVIANAVNIEPGHSSA